MKAVLTFAVALLIGIGSAGAEAPQWTVDAKASRITFTAKQMQVPITGRFTKFTAAIRFDPDDLPGSKVSIDIDVASVSTPNADIEAEIKRQPWFDVAHHPTAHFETLSFMPKGGDRYEAAGQLTLRGVTKPIALPVTIRISGDPNGLAQRAQASGDVTVSRTAFGVGQGQWRDTAVVADDVVIRFEITAQRAKAGR